MDGISFTSEDANRLELPETIAKKNDLDNNQGVNKKTMFREMEGIKAKRVTKSWIAYYYSY